MIIKQQRNLKKEFRHGHFSNVNKEEQYKKKYVQGERKGRWRREKVSTAVVLT